MIFFRTVDISALLENNTIPIVQQLPQNELENFDINHLGAVFNIKPLNKEEKLMDNIIEKLEAYRAELESQKMGLLSTDIMPIVEQEVAKYREQITAEIQADLDAKVNKVASDIACIQVIIDREKAAAEYTVNEQITMDSITE